MQDLSAHLLGGGLRSLDMNARLVDTAIFPLFLSLYLRNLHKDKANIINITVLDL